MKTILETGLLAGLAACALATSAVAGQTGPAEPTAIAVPVAGASSRIASTPPQIPANKVARFMARAGS